jgi:uncharacterized membrane protein YhaH (DUF805 family)
MSFGQAIASGFKNYVNFTGRAARSEFWYWILFGVIVAVVMTIIDLAVFRDAAVRPLTTIADLALLLPTLAVSVRRMHDLDRSGWDVVVIWILVFGTIIRYIIWCCTRGTPGPNRFGPPPSTGS